jgi:hypothetical protein
LIQVWIIRLVIPLMNLLESTVLVMLDPDGMERMLIKRCPEYPSFVWGVGGCPTGFDTLVPRYSTGVGRIEINVGFC